MCNPRSSQSNSKFKCGCYAMRNRRSQECAHILNRERCRTPWCWLFLCSLYTCMTLPHLHWPLGMRQEDQRPCGGGSRPSQCSAVAGLTLQQGKKNSFIPDCTIELCARPKNALIHTFLQHSTAQHGTALLCSPCSTRWGLSCDAHSSFTLTQCCTDIRLAPVVQLLACSSYMRYMSSQHHQQGTTLNPHNAR